MNRYLLTCVLVGAFAGAAVALFVANAGPLAGQDLLRVLLGAAVGAVLGYATSAVRPSLFPVHPYARPAQRDSRQETGDRSEVRADSDRTA